MKLTLKLEEKDGAVVHEGFTVHAEGVPGVGDTIDLCGQGRLPTGAASFYTVAEVTWRGIGGELAPVIVCRWSCNNSGRIRTGK
jgi:hypothetical protein